MDDTKLYSVGIDIGTSTSQVIFSRLTVANRAGRCSVPFVEIVDKEVIYRSPIHRTPMLNPWTIDGEALRTLVAEEYAACGLRPDQLATGAVIITGEAARKRNAALVLERLSGLAGDFVVETAGPDLESAIAGRGSGAQRFSEETGAAVVNLDIGGGTTNAALFLAGELAAWGCLDIGGRQVEVSADGTVRAVSVGAQRIIRARRLPIREGEKADRAALEALCDGMNELLEQLTGLLPPSPLLEEIASPGSTKFAAPPGADIRYICFSGGVADCVYAPAEDDFAYGDIGVLLGRAIRRGRLLRDFRVAEAAETIRATVIGADSYTTTISGSTISYAEDLFPLKNIPLLRLNEGEEAACWSGDGGALLERVRWFLAQSDADLAALAIQGRRDPEYAALRRLAETLAGTLDRTLPEGAPLLVIVRRDMAKALGQRLAALLGARRPVAVLDGISADQGTFIDLGRPVMDGMALPVVVKTLLFG